MEPEPSLLRRYRHDRRQLLNFILSSSGLIKEVRNPSGASNSISDDHLDVLSADYVLECVQSGGVLDISKAAKECHDKAASSPITIHTQFGDSYFLLSDPESAGSPPRRVPPSVNVKHNHGKTLCPPNFLDPPMEGNVDPPGVFNGVKCVATPVVCLKPTRSFDLPSLGLPSLNTGSGFHSVSELMFSSRIYKGLSDDDLRESAYEILLATLIFSSGAIHQTEDRKKEKSPKFLSGLKVKRDKRSSQSPLPGGNPELIDSIRVQMQISEAVDICTRKRLAQFASASMSEQIDVPQICLGLLAGMSKTDFPNDKFYAQWKKRQVYIIEELSCFGNSRPEQKHVSDLLMKVKYSKDLNMMPPSEEAEVLMTIKEIVLALSSVPPKFGIQSETYYWTAGYHLNIRLYEKLLFGVFDTLEESQLIEESDQLLKVIKLTWSILGINRKIHNALFAWVLFQQFVRTDEEDLLDFAIREVKHLFSVKNTNEKEERYLKSLMCSIVCDGREIKTSLTDALRSSLSFWCDYKLQDYHLYFHQKPSFFRKVLTLSVAAGKPKFGEDGGTESKNVEVDDNKFRTYVELSVKAASFRVVSSIDLESKVARKHPLALLANELKSIAERELNTFGPVLRQWFIEGGMLSATLLHQFYGENLKPFLSGVSHLSEDVKSVLPAAYELDRYLAQLYSFACEDNGSDSCGSTHFDRYQIKEICGPIILDWIIAQNERVLEWTGRVFDLEHWEPISHQQKHAASAIEVFRIIDGTVDELFGFSLPLDITHLQAMLSVIFHTLDVYLMKLVNQIVDKRYLYPSVPPLTRYEDTVFPVMKKKLVDSMLVEDEVKDKLKLLTVSTLCIRLNTLHYIRKQVQKLEDSIRKSWMLVIQYEGQARIKGPSKTSGSPDIVNTEPIDELFVATFDTIKDAVADATRKICDFTGTKLVFWDLRDSFLLHLYRGSVEGARLDGILPYFDTFLNNVCTSIDEDLRDLVVSSICRATMEGYVWVLLDGGPSRAFADLDTTSMNDDLDMLKELFVAEGEGLPRSQVEKEAIFAHQVLCLFSLQTEAVIEKLMTASEQIPVGRNSRNGSSSSRYLGDAHTLIRVLCHKKDKDATKFLKRQYQLPASSEYDDTSSSDNSNSKSYFGADFLMRNTSFQWSADNGNSSFRSIKERFKEATSEIRHVGW